MKTIFLSFLVFPVLLQAKELICEKTEVGQGKRIVLAKSQTVEGVALLNFQSELDSNIRLIGYYDAKNQMIGAHINDETNKTSSGSYADLTKEKPYAKVNYRKQTEQGLFLYVLECLEK